MPYYPLFLDLTGRRCLVVGAGPVGQRKAAGLLAAGAVVRVVAPESPELSGAEWVAAEYEPEHLDGMALVFAAGPPDVNARVVADARQRGIWVNSASDPTSGDFLLPAVRRAGRIEVAVSTAGASPASRRRSPIPWSIRCRRSGPSTSISSPSCGTRSGPPSRGRSGPTCGVC